MFKRGEDPLKQMGIGYEEYFYKNHKKIIFSIFDKIVERNKNFIFDKRKDGELYWTHHNLGNFSTGVFLKNYFIGVSYSSTDKKIKIFINIREHVKSAKSLYLLSSIELKEKLEYYFNEYKNK